MSDTLTMREALKQLVEAATVTVTARYTEDRKIPSLVVAISDARDAMEADAYGLYEGREGVWRMSDTHDGECDCVQCELERAKETSE